MRVPCQWCPQDMVLHELKNGKRGKCSASGCECPGFDAVPCRCSHGWHKGKCGCGCTVYRAEGEPEPPCPTCGRPMRPRKEERG